MLRRSGLASLMLLAAMASPAAASPGADILAGVWRDDEDAAAVRLEPCPDGSLCGEFIRQPPGADLEVVAGLRQRSATRWAGGRVYNLNDGATYLVEVEVLSPQSLQVRACWLSFCETRLWRRVE